MEDKDVEYLLNFIDKSEDKIFPFNPEISADKEKEISKYYHEIMKFEYMEYDLKLLNSIEIADNYKVYSLNSKAKGIQRNGGWYEYLKLKKHKEEREIRREISELKISEFQSNNPKLPYFISICGVLVSFAALIITLNKEYKPTQDTQYIKNKKQIENISTKPQKECLDTISKKTLKN